MNRKISAILLSIMIIAFGTNFIWEKLQIVLYKDYETFIARLPLPVALYTTLVDTGIVLAIYLFIAVTSKNLFWVQSIKARHIWQSMLIGIIISTIIEWHALVQGQWAYNEAMPIIPLLQVGLSPILQMIILPLVSFSIGFLINKKINK